MKLNRNINNQTNKNSKSTNKNLKIKYKNKIFILFKILINTIVVYK